MHAKSWRDANTAWTTTVTLPYAFLRVAERVRATEEESLPQSTGNVTVCEEML